MPNPYIIVISCVTTETVMVSSPSIFYKADEVHLFRYIRDPGTACAKLYEDHFQSVCKQIRSSLPECLVTEHTDDPVYDLPRMVRALSVLYSRIRREHPDAEVHANLSSGPSEFIAALGIFAYLDSYVFRTLFRWGMRKHADKGKKWIADRYWHPNGKRLWEFCTVENTLFRPIDVKKKRHVKVRNKMNPHIDTAYFQERQKFRKHERGYRDKSFAV